MEPFQALQQQCFIQAALWPFKLDAHCVFHGTLVSLMLTDAVCKRITWLDA